MALENSLEVVTALLGDLKRKAVRADPKRRSLVATRDAGFGATHAASAALSCLRLGKNAVRIPIAGKNEQIW